VADGFGVRYFLNKGSLLNLKTLSFFPQITKIICTCILWFGCCSISVNFSLAISQSMKVTVNKSSHKKEIVTSRKQKQKSLLLNSKATVVRPTDRSVRKNDGLIEAIHWFTGQVRKQSDYESNLVAGRFPEPVSAVTTPCVSRSIGTCPIPITTRPTTPFYQLPDL
jgi:hypothetical protein